MAAYQKRQSLEKRTPSSESTSQLQRPGKTDLHLTADDAVSGAVARKPKPSDKLNPKTVEAFGKSGKQSSFATLYADGMIPCKLVHGSVKHKLGWNIPPEQVPFETVLVYLAEGLRESVHPYTFVAREGFKELLNVSDAGRRAAPLIPKLAPLIRAALCHADDSVFEASLDALVHLSTVVGPALNSHLSLLLVPISKRMMNKKFREIIINDLHQLEIAGGKACLPIIKSKVPTYTPII